MYFVELNFDILMNVVHTISSIYSFDAFSRMQVKNLEFLDLRSLGCYSCKSIWASVIWNSRKIWSSKSSIFQKMMISKLIRTCTSWKLYRSLNLQFFSTSELQFFIQPKDSIYREILWTLGGLWPICLLGLDFDQFTCWA